MVYQFLEVFIACEESHIFNSELIQASDNFVLDVVDEAVIDVDLNKVNTALAFILSFFQ